MFIALNVGVLILIALIAYWWANQGLFSALLHLLCVIVAGAIAFAFWEPLTVNLLLRGWWLDDYVWGLSLVALFSISLLLLRVAFDKVAPNNVDLPNSANLLFGGIAGVAAGVITLGILVISAGLVQSDRNVLDFRGYGRDANGRVQEINNLWVPVHQLTSNFYDMLSAGALSTSTPMAQVNPNIYQQTTLLRDSYTRSGVLAGRVSIIPDALRVENAEYVNGPEGERYSVTVSIERKGFDGGTQMILAPTQVRLIAPPSSGSGSGSVGFPELWTQETDSGAQHYRFDDTTHFATSVPGQERVTFRFEFPVGRGEGQVAPGHTPRYIQIKNVRYRLPAVTDVQWSVFQNNRLTLDSDTAPIQMEQDPTAPPIPESEINVSNRIRGLALSKNRVGQSMRIEEEDFLAEGRLRFNKGQDRPSRGLRIEGIYQPQGVRIVQLNVSRGTVADINGPVQRVVGDDARVYLVDSNGNRYSPRGYVLEAPSYIDIFLDPGRGVGTIDDLPMLPSSGEQQLYLVFQVTEGAELVRVMFDEATAGNLDLIVDRLSR